MKKRAPRTYVKTKITGALIVDESFHLINISDTGALINTSQKLKMGSAYNLRFNFFSMDKKATLKLKTIVVRATLCSFTESGKGEKVPIYEVGLSFIDTAEKNIKNLKILIAQKELSKISQ